MDAAQVCTDGTEWVSVSTSYQMTVKANVFNRYIIAPKFRAALAAMWELPDLNHWWLPNDEGYPDIVREIRAMTEERTNQPRDDFRENVRDMKSLFWKLSVDDRKDEQSPQSSHSSFPS